MSLARKTIFMSGGNRGIGLANALRAARDGANVALAAKTADPRPKLEGTIHTAAAVIEEAGGKGPPLMVDIGDEHRVAAGRPMAIVAQVALGFADDRVAALNFPLANAAVTTLLQGSAGLSLGTLNSFQHLELVRP